MHKKFIVLLWSVYHKLDFHFLTHRLFQVSFFSQFFSGKTYQHWLYELLVSVQFSGMKYIHVVVQPSTPSISINSFRLVKLKLYTFKQ